MNFRILLMSFGLVFLAELGDKTQLTALAFATSSRSPWMVFIGTSLALITTTALAVVFGSLLSRVLPEKAMHIASAVLFILMGLVLLVNLARKAPVDQPASEGVPPAAQSRSAVFALVTSQAISFEEEIVALLDHIVERCPEGAMRDALRQIAAEDRAHLHSITHLGETQTEVVAAMGGDVPPEDLALLAARCPQPQELGSPHKDAAPGAAMATIRDDIQRVIESEEAVADFYLALARKATIHAVRDAFRWLAMEDIRHAQTLCSLINPSTDEDGPGENPMQNS